MGKFFNDTITQKVWFYGFWIQTFSVVLLLNVTDSQSRGLDYIVDLKNKATVQMSYDSYFSGCALNLKNRDIFAINECKAQAKRFSVRIQEALEPDRVSK